MILLNSILFIKRVIVTIQWVIPYKIQVWNSISSLNTKLFCFCTSCVVAACWRPTYLNYSICSAALTWKVCWFLQLHFCHPYWVISGQLQNLVIIIIIIIIMSLLYGRTNMLIRRFFKCSGPVKLCLFKSYCINFYGMALWKNYRKTSILKVETAYVKCMQMFLGYERKFSVRQMFQDLGLPTFNTLLHNLNAWF